MKLLLDLQAIQGASGRRGIGRYSFELARALAETAAGHELFIAMSDRLSIPWERIDTLNQAGVPGEKILTISHSGGSAEVNPANAERARLAEIIWTAALVDLKPDVIHISSLFEGFFDEVITSIGARPTGIPTSVTLYDLIPLIRQGDYLTRKEFRNWYFLKLQELRKADHLLAISRSSKQEAVSRLGIGEDRITVIDAGISPFFHNVAGDGATVTAVHAKFGLDRQFVLYTGGIDPRKNPEGAIAGFAALPSQIRSAHQLAIVCAISSEDCLRLAKLARGLGLSDRQVLFTNYVTDDELRVLYSTCAAFIFTSLHEGFGLPVLEAMACSAPVLGSNTSSMPDLIGREDALFDPQDPQSIGSKLAKVLSDKEFADDLRRYGIERARGYTWRRSAEAAWAAFESMPAQSSRRPSTPMAGARARQRLAYVSPLPPIRSGIADYSAELLPALADHFEIDVIVDQPTIDDAWIVANLNVRDVATFDRSGSHYDAILYNIGNSEYHTHMFDLIERWPGVVILHDFFLSDVFRVLGHKGSKEAWFRRLFFSHGWPAVSKFPTLKVSGEAIRRYPCTLSVLEHATAVISHSSHAATLAEEYFGPNTVAPSVVLPFPRRPGPSGGREASRRERGLHDDEVLFCSFGFTMEFKLPHRILDVWPAVHAATGGKARLAFVGECPDNPYGRKLRERIGETAGVTLTGFAERDVYSAYLSACDVAIQLRTASRGETSAAALDCFAYGIPTIVNAHGSFAELPDDATIKIPDAFSDDELAEAMTGLASSRDRREHIGRAALSHLRSVHDPATVAADIARVIAKADGGPNGRLNRLVRQIAARPDRVGEADLLPVAHSLAMNRVSRRPPELLIDVSVLMQRDVGSGIQRVVRNVVRNIVSDGTPELRPEPVRVGSDLAYARDFSARFFSVEALGERDGPAELKRGGVFLGLDLNQDISPQAMELLRRRNIPIYVVVYDLLPVLRPELFGGPSPRFINWLRLIAETADGLICISHAVAHELQDWLDREGPRGRRPLKIGVFRLGSDLEGVGPQDMAPSEKAIVEAACARPVILMVGTIEPRKGHRQAIAAFKSLRNRGIDANLVIVGKAGWAVEQLVAQMRSLDPTKDGVFWIEQASDGALQALYARSSLLLAASVGEGFGLPLVEAAHFGLPVLARDIPVFREVAGETAAFFSGESGEELADALEQWFGSQPTGAKARQVRAHLVGWAESARQLMNLARGRGWQYSWAPGMRQADAGQPGMVMRAD